MVNVPVEHAVPAVPKLNVPFAIVERYAKAPVPIMVPVDDPDIKATETFRFELAAVDTWPLTVKLVPLLLIAGKHDDGGLFTAVTVALRVLPF